MDAIRCVNQRRECGRTPLPLSFSHCPLSPPHSLLELSHLISARTLPYRSPILADTRIHVPCIYLSIYLSIYLQLDVSGGIGTRFVASIEDVSVATLPCLFHSSNVLCLLLILLTGREFIPGSPNLARTLPYSRSHSR